MESALSRREELFAFFVHACSGRIGRTQLVKLMYLADFESYRYLGRPISDFRWTKRDYGPFDTAFYSVKEALESRGLIAEDVRVNAKGEEWHGCYGTGLLPELTFSTAELRIVEHVVAEYSKLPRERLVNDVVYETAPFREVSDAPHGTPIPLESVANEGRLADDGLDLDAIEKGRARLRAGQGVPLEHALNALRGNR